MAMDNPPNIANLMLSNDVRRFEQGVGIKYLFNGLHRTRQLVLLTLRHGAQHLGYFPV